MTDEARPVWITREQIEWFRTAPQWMLPEVGAIVAAWDAAPADPAKALEREFYPLEDAWWLDRLVPGILEALGKP